MTQPWWSLAYHRILRYRSISLDTPSNFPDRRIQKWKWPLLPFSPFSFSIIRIRIYALFYLLFRLIIVLLYNNLFPNNFLRSFFFSFPSLSSRSGDERERRRNRVFFYFPSLLFRSGDERERERERVIFFSFPSLPFLFCICQPFIIFHSFSNWETKERERGRKIEKKVFFYFPSPRLPTFFHFPSTSKLGDERERESRFFSFPSFPFLFHICQPFIIFHSHPNWETKERERERNRTVFPLRICQPFIIFHPNWETRGRESFSFLFLLFYFSSAFANLLSFSTSRSGDERKKERERVFFFLFSSICLLSFSIHIQKKRKRKRNRVVFFYFPSLFANLLSFSIHVIHPDRETKERERERERKKNRAALSDERGSLPRVWRISPVSLPFFPQGSQDGDSDRSFERRVRDRIWSFGHLSTSAGGTGIGKHRRFSWKCGGGIISGTPHVKLTGLTGNGGGWLVRGLFR